MVWINYLIVKCNNILPLHKLSGFETAKFMHLYNNNKTPKQFNNSFVKIHNIHKRNICLSSKQDQLYIVTAATSHTDWMEKVLN